MAFYPHAEADSVNPDTIRYQSDEYVITQQDLWDHMSGASWAPWLKSPAREPATGAQAPPSSPAAHVERSASRDMAPVNRNRMVQVSHDEHIHQVAQPSVQRPAQQVRQSFFSWCTAAAGSLLEYMPVSSPARYIAELSAVALENPCSWVSHCRRIIGKVDEPCVDVVARLAPKLASAVRDTNHVNLADDAAVQEIAQRCSDLTRRPVVVVASTPGDNAVLWRHVVASCGTTTNGHGYILALSEGHVELLEPPPSTWSNQHCNISSVVCGVAGFLSQQTLTENARATQFVTDDSDVSWHVTDKLASDLITELVATPLQRDVYPADPHVVDAGIQAATKALGFFSDWDMKTLHTIIDGAFAVGLGVVVCSSHDGFRYVVPCPAGGSRGKLLATGGAYIAYEYINGLACAVTPEYGTMGSSSASASIPTVHQFQPAIGTVVGCGSSAASRPRTSGVGDFAAGLRDRYHHADFPSNLSLALSTSAARLTSEDKKAAVWLPRVLDYVAGDAHRRGRGVGRPANGERDPMFKDCDFALSLMRSAYRHALSDDNMCIRSPGRSSCVNLQGTKGEMINVAGLPDAALEGVTKPDLLVWRCQPEDFSKVVADNDFIVTLGGRVGQSRAHYHIVAAESVDHTLVFAVDNHLLRVDGVAVRASELKVQCVLLAVERPDTVMLASYPASVRSNSLAASIASTLGKSPQAAEDRHRRPFSCSFIGREQKMPRGSPARAATAPWFMPAGSRQHGAPKTGAVSHRCKPSIPANVEAPTPVAPSVTHDATATPSDKGSSRPKRSWKSTTNTIVLEPNRLAELPVHEDAAELPGRLSADIRTITRTPVQSPNACGPLSEVLDEGWRDHFPEETWVYVQASNVEAPRVAHAVEYVVVRGADNAPRRVDLTERASRPVTVFRSYATGSVAVMAAVFQDVYGVTRPNLAQDETLFNTVHAYTSAKDVANAIVVAVLEGSVQRRSRSANHRQGRQAGKVGMHPTQTITRGYMVRRDAPGVVATERAGFENKWALARGPSATRDAFRWLHDAYYSREVTWSEVLGGRGPSSFTEAVKDGIRSRWAYCRAWLALQHVPGDPGEAGMLKLARSRILNQATHDGLRQFMEDYLSQPDMGHDPLGFGTYYPPTENKYAYVAASRDPCRSDVLNLD